MKRLFIFAMVLLPLLFFVGCSKKSEQNLEKVRLGEVTRSVFYAPQYVAIEKGFFADQGLEVSLQTTWGGDKTMTALLSNAIDVALVGSETSIYVHEQDSKDIAVNFAQLTRTDGTFLVAKEQARTFEWKDLNESKFLGQRKGGMPQMVGEYVLKKHGLDPQNDLELRQNIDFANIPSAFVSTDAEYVQLFEPTASIFEKEGKGSIVASFGEELEEIPYTSFMAKESFLNERSETAQKFTNAIYQAQQWVEENNAREIAAVIEPYFEDTDQTILASSIQRYKDQGSYATTPELSKEGWKRLNEIMYEANELKEAVPYEDLVRTDFAQKAIK